MKRLAARCATKAFSTLCTLEWPCSAFSLLFNSETEIIKIHISKIHGQVRSCWLQYKVMFARTTTVFNTAYLLITYTLSQCTVTCQGDALSLLWWTKSNCSKDQWDWEIIDYYVALPLQQWVSVLFGADCPQKVLNIARLHCHKGMHYSKKFDLVHQTVSPCERMKSGTCKAVLIPSRQSQSSCTKIVHLLGRWSGGLRCGGAPN